MKVAIHMGAAASVNCKRPSQQPPVCHPLRVLLLSATYAERKHLDRGW